MGNSAGCALRHERTRRAAAFIEWTLAKGSTGLIRLLAAMMQPAVRRPLRALPPNSSLHAPAEISAARLSVLPPSWSGDALPAL